MKRFEADMLQAWLTGYFEAVAEKSTKEKAEELAARVIAELEKRGWGPK